MLKIYIIEANKLNLKDSQYQAQYDAAYAEYKYGESLQGIKYDYPKDGSIIQIKASVKRLISANKTSLKEKYPSANGYVRTSEFVQDENENYLKSQWRTLVAYCISAKKNSKDILELDKKNKKKSEKDN